MPLRRLSAREYLVDLVATTLAWPIYSRREWMDREALDRFALRRTRDMAVNAARSVLADDGSLAGDGLVRDPVSANLVGEERTALYRRVDLLRRD